MGMYTELILGIEFSNDTPEYIIEAFDYLINKLDDAEISDDARTFIDEYHVSMMLFGCSYYFAVTNPNYAFYRDGIDKKWHLSSRANLKNGGRIEKFLNFIKDYVADGSGPRHLFAYVQYEESEFPTLWFPEGPCKYDISSIEARYDKAINKYYDTFNTLYSKFCPDFVLTTKILEKHGLTPSTYTQHDCLCIGLEEVANRISKSYDEQLENTMKLNRKLLDVFKEIMIQSSYLESDIKNLKEEIEKHPNGDLLDLVEELEGTKLMIDEHLKKVIEE
jgi:hypothetical protein